MANPTSVISFTVSSSGCWYFAVRKKWVYNVLNNSNSKSTSLYTYTVKLNIDTKTSAVDYLSQEINKLKIQFFTLLLISTIIIVGYWSQNLVFFQQKTWRNFMGHFFHFQISILLHSSSGVVGLLVAGFRHLSTSFNRTWMFFLVNMMGFHQNQILSPVWILTISVAKRNTYQTIKLYYWDKNTLMYNCFLVSRFPFFYTSFFFSKDLLFIRKKYFFSHI